jgi:hypothetical protein
MGLRSSERGKKMNPVETGLDALLSGLLTRLLIVKKLCLLLIGNLEKYFPQNAGLL